VNIDVVPPDGAALKDAGARRTIVVGIGSSWSPDDTQLVFNTCRGSTCGIYRSLAAPGSEAVLVVGDNGAAPVWSPDGTQIVYQAEVDGNKQLFLINPDGSGKKQLTSGAAVHVSAAWSPDGAYIYHRSPQGGTWGIWRMNADGSNSVKLIDNVPPVDWAFERLAVTR
jgi:TolB protein